MFLKTKICLVILFTSSSSMACAITKWSLEGKPISVCYHSKLKATMSAECKERNCSAKTLLNKSKSFSKIARGQQPMVNSGAWICKALKGKVLMAKNKSHSQIAFCQANDKSVVSLSSLGNNTF